MKTIFILSVIALPAMADSLTDSLTQSVLADYPKGTRVSLERVHTNIPVTGEVSVSSVTPQPGAGLVSFEASTFSGKKKTPGPVVRGTAFVKVWSKIAVATRPIQHKESFTPKNVAFEERELSELLAKGYFLTPSALMDKRARGYIRSGQPLGLNNTDTALQVESGKLVDMVRTSGALSVAAKVRAIDGGRSGDMIRVENPASHKILTAKVVNAESVEVN